MALARERKQGREQCKEESCAERQASKGPEPAFWAWPLSRGSSKRQKMRVRERRKPGVRNGEGAETGQAPGR